MENWEIKLRKDLEKELEDGFYSIVSGKFVALISKDGKINYEVAFKKELIKQGITTNEQLNKQDKFIPGVGKETLDKLFDAHEDDDFIDNDLN